jgi:hypothetical protein
MRTRRRTGSCGRSWATATPKFRDLEKLAGLDHMRPHYGWASHRMHAGAKGAALNIVSRGPQSVYLTGPCGVALSVWGPGAARIVRRFSSAWWAPGGTRHEELTSESLVGGSDDPYVELRFRDSLNRWWFRAKDGTLRRMDEAEAAEYEVKGNDLLGSPVANEQGHG